MGAPVLGAESVRKPIDSGTLVSVPSQSRALAGTAPPPVDPLVVKSQTVEKRAADGVVGEVGQLTLDSFVRAYIYEPAAQALSEQGSEFVRLGTMTRQEAATWVNAQRNALVIAVRDTRNSPVGKAIAEYLKPRDKLPDVPTLVKKIAGKHPEMSEEQIFEAIISSGARTRGSVNRVAVAFRWAGPVLIVVSLSFSAYIIAEAPPEQRGRVASREGGALLLGFTGGWVGAKLGCEGGAAVGVWLDGVGAIPGCLIGAVVGGFGVGWAGSAAGAELGEITWSAANTAIRWLEPAN